MSAAIKLDTTPPLHRATVTITLPRGWQQATATNGWRYGAKVAVYEVESASVEAYTITGYSHQWEVWKMENRRQHRIAMDARKLVSNDGLYIAVTTAPGFDPLHTEMEYTINPRGGE